MANYYTRIIRIYSKSNFNKINIEEITNTIVRTATMSGLIYYVNTQENCLDIKFCSKRASGTIDLDFDNFDIWEIRENEIFHNEINYTSKDVTFGFDEIRFDSKNEILNHEFFKYFMVLKANGNAIEKDGILIIKESGSYYVSIMYDIEIDDPKEQIKQVNLEKFIEPIEDYSGIGGILDNEKLCKGFDKFDFFLNHPHDEEVFKLYEGFKSIKFLWQGRVVNEVYKTETYWSGMTSDWWDNCLLPEWIRFRTERRIQYNTK